MRPRRVRSNGWTVAVAVSVLGSLLLSCSAATRSAVLGTIFDGVPEPGARAPKAPPQHRPPAPVPPTEPPVPAGPERVADRPAIPAAPLDALATWPQLLKALPTDASGAVDWVRAFDKHLITPRFMPRAVELPTLPLTLDSLLELTASDPRVPALDLTMALAPSSDLSPEAAALYGVTFPHAAHTEWMNCTSCHPGVLEAKTGMLGILKGDYCGRCHGRVSFAPDLSCGRCHPRLAPPSPETITADVATARGAAVAASPLVIERGANTYRQLCAVCHGETGDGNGPLSPPLDPKPLDFTAGEYEFRSTLPGSIPTDLDIFGTITRGVPGTSMPSFAAIPIDDRWALVQYIKTFSDKFAGAEPQPLPVVPAPEVTPALLTMGHDLYQQACSMCHGDTGRGDGPVAPALKDGRGNLLSPFNFASGRPMKGGTGREAVYRRVMAGLQGTPMPGFGDAWTPEQGWAVSSYVLTLFGQDRQPFAVKGDIAFVRSTEVPGAENAGDYPPVVFPHWVHRVRIKCASCHPRVFEMRAGANPVTMDAMRSGQYCATCHNGTAAWEIGFTTCIKCHVQPGP